MNCHQCRFRGQVPGSAHYSCQVLNNNDPEMGNMIGLMVVAGQCEITYLDEDNQKRPCVELDEHGIKNGWAMWPINFDPVWVNSCKFFTKDE